MKIGKLRWVLVTSVLFCLGPSVIAQEIQVSDPRLELRDNTIHITYDILNSSPSDEFTVRLTVEDDRGQTIRADALSGDIGDMVYGGKGKEIRWDLTADGVEMEAQIFFKVYAKPVPPPEPVVVSIPEEELSSEEEKEEVVESEQTNIQNASGGPSTEESKHFSRAGIIGQSIVFPGLGLSRVTGKPHWLRGVATYGCLAGSVVMNRMAFATYNGIYGIDDFREREEQYQKSLSQDQTSEILAYAALAIWVSDFIWTVAGTGNLKAMTYGNDRSGFSFYSSVDPLSTTPLLGFSYKF
jgi:hypothetical protein